MPTTKNIETLKALRAARTRILQRKALHSLAWIIIVLVGWSAAFRFAPRQVAPLSPSAAVEVVAAGTAFATNTVYEELAPEHRQEKIQRFRNAIRHTRPDTSSEPVCFSIELIDAPMFSDSDLLTPSLPTQPSLSMERASMDFSGPTSKPSHESIEVLIIGLDSRLGRERGRADAIHLVSIEPDFRRVTITSIPRGTPSKLGYSSPGANIISHIRAARGRDAFIKRVASLCGKEKIPYFIEVGFSQSMGILELLGFENPMSELQALRKRKGFQLGDHERSYNQGEFLRRSLLAFLPKLEGATGELLLRAGLHFVETNLTPELCLGLVYTLNDAGLAGHAERVRHVLFGPFEKRFARRPPIDFTTHAVVGLTEGKIKSGDGRAESRIRAALAKACRHVQSPRQVKRDLWQIFTQRGWLQISDKETRKELRDSIAYLLHSAFATVGDVSALRDLRSVLRTDSLLFSENKAVLRR